MDFHAIFKQQQRILELELELARERFSHYGLRGNAVETALRDFLERHIPRALTAGTGEVVASESDTDRRKSGQIDIILSNMSQPFLSSRDVPSTFFIEGVHMAGEVKATLGRSVVATELEKARHFRSLRARNVSRLVAVPKPDSWTTYYVFYRPYFLLSVETTGKWQSVLLEIMEFIETNGTMPLDGVFLLDKNVVILLSPYLDFPQSNLTGIPFEHKVDGQTVTGGIHVYKTDVPLALFLAWISTFRGSFFEDQHPIGFYIQEVLNKSIAETVLYEDDRPAAETLQKLAKQGIFKATLEGLRSAYPKK
ncbi:DUF6602 domain-containing protein [Endobacterium cereale]|uniref:DUF6602 domain-containing protein n=1 Tax=Endobacterium cereale TaxID=2663029 RepID=UPI002B47D365|nr:DUF6602 domain-containing protein [Endobacterium cereale]MEB2848194.1 DUF6602 domain-containing protein [Endobacterium cereale]